MGHILCSLWQRQKKIGFLYETANCGLGMKKIESIFCLLSCGMKIFKRQFCQLLKKLKTMRTEYNGRQNSYTSTEQSIHNLFCTCILN